MSGDQLGALLPLVLIVVALWFLMIRPVRNRQRQMTATQSELAVGAEVLLTSGLFGTVTWLGEETMRLEVAPETTVRIHRQAIARVLSDEERTRMASESSDVSEPTASDLDDDTASTEKED